MVTLTSILFCPRCRRERAPENRVIFSGRAWLCPACHDLGAHSLLQVGAREVPAFVPLTSPAPGHDPAPDR